MTANEIYAKLKQLAPDVVFENRFVADPYFVWDGDSPDPAEDGFEACNVTVSARTIVDGELVDGNAYMGGHYRQPGEPLGDIGGYLPQMLEEAVLDLSKFVKSADVRAQLHTVLSFLKQEMKARYDEQMAGKGTDEGNKGEYHD